uniref:Uncharacterized protein n=1 Tax=Meloidogyne enterolobii TaxID=390850 RepID=A0A6V7WYI1_MELEN|nr:unnamed protein product [Meloidogyne enterolobii]
MQVFCRSFRNTFLWLNFIFSFVLLTSQIELSDRKDIISSSTNTASASLIRQCSCTEESICINSFKNQVHDCFNTCWTQDVQIKALSANPEHLKKCFTNKTLLDKFINCLKKTHQTCVSVKNGAGEKRLKSQVQAFMQEMSLENQKLVQSAVNIGMCVKGCLIQRDKQDSCFDHSGCHPKLEEQLIGPIIKRCGRKVGWKKDLGEVCDCVTNAGFISVKPYCMLLHGHSNK